MSQNLSLLRQDHCRPVVLNGPPDLFPLERESQQGKVVLAKPPKGVLRLQEFNPIGLRQTYRDEQTGTELPVFAAFNLEGSSQLTCEITMSSFSLNAEPGSLPFYLPFEGARELVKKINQKRMERERVALRVSAVVGFIGLVVFLLSNVLEPTAAALPFLSCLSLGVWLVGTLFTYLAWEFLLNRICPWKKLILTAVFDGIIPQKTRDIAVAAKNRFDHLYLVVDQEKRWQSQSLPDPAQQALDPLLIGEMAGDASRRLFLLDQFDLTMAEQYLADEFATSLKV
ncbi:MAG: hypothetical protein JO025_01965 [Verrucomicrobia bacterium]|nr:hypothetical protein [Verrucomicrobiota bacterium]